MCSSAIAGALQRWRSARVFPFTDITVARIVLDFAPPPWPRASYYKLQWGDQFTVTVTIEADGRAVGMAPDAGYCRPHGAARKENLLVF